MPELTEEQIETVKQLLHRVSVLEENSLPKLETQVMSLTDLTNNLARRIHPLEVSTPAIINSVSDLGAEIHSYIAENCQLKSQMPLPVTTSSSVRIKPPASFTGQASYIDSFFIQLSVVFAADETRFATDEKKILFTIGCLSGNALSYVQPFIKDIEAENKPEILNNYKEFKKLLYDAFGDSNPVINSESAIRSLRQTGSATKYSTEFRRISMQLSWNNDALVSQYVLNLKDQIKDELARLEPIKDLNQIIAKSIDIDNRLFARYQQRSFSNNNRTYQPRQTQQPTNRSGPTPMELNYVGQPSYEIQNAQPTPITPIINFSNQRRGPISTEEKDRRRKNNLCLYCGLPGHFTAACPNKNNNHHHRSAYPTISTILMNEDKLDEQQVVPYGNYQHSINAIISTNNDQQLNLVDSVKVSKPEVLSTYKQQVKLRQASIEKSIMCNVDYVTLSMVPGLIVIPVSLDSNGVIVRNVKALIDSGSSTSFISSSLVIKESLPFVVSTPSTFRLADNSIHCTSKMSCLLMELQDTHHKEFINLHHLDSSAHDVILGQDWLAHHNPAFDWTYGTVALTCLFRGCLATKLPCTNNDVITIEDSDDDHIANINSSINSPDHSTPPPISKVFNEINNDVSSHYFNDSLSSNQLNISTSTTKAQPLQLTKNKKLELPINYKAEQKLVTPSTSSSPYIEKIIDSHTNSESSNKPTVDLSTTNTLETVMLPDEYKDFEIVFSKQEADRLPPHRPYDHTIPLKASAEVGFGPLYNLSKIELDTLYEYLQENLAKGFIERSESPAGAPVFFVKKKDGSLRPVVDYRNLNKITIPNRCPLPLISETLDRLHTAKIFTKLDMRGAYNLLRIAKGHEWKTAFRTRYGHFQYRVMPFGLCNAPASFQTLVNDTLREYLDSFVVVYLDDILIFSTTPEEHTQHVRLVLQKLKDARLSLKLSKCEFNSLSISFLGFVISPNHISMDPEKVEAIKNWKDLSSVHDIQVFLGLTNFYKRFIANYSKLCVPLTALLKKDTPFIWNGPARTAFNLLKDAIVTNPVLRHFNPNVPCILETDASDFALGAVLSQKAADDGLNHPIAFYSRKLVPAELNYQIYDKELLSIVAAFKHWRHYLEFSVEPTLVLTDHKNLEYFSTTRDLSRRQVRWAEFLGDFNYTILYRPGKNNGAADALSRKDRPSEGGNSRGKIKMTLLDPKLFLNSITSATLEPEQNKLLQKIIQALPQDTYFGSIIKNIHQDPTSEPKFSLNKQILFYQGLICIPNLDDIKRTILEECHDSLSAGHFGIAKTYDMVSRNYYWPSMRAYVKDYVSGCDTCNRNKISHHKPYGLLQPLAIPDTPWTSISVDFITQLPPSGRFSAICVFVDRFTKMALFIPTTNQVNAEETAQLFITHVFCQFGLPSDVVSDRGATFTSKFTQAILKGLNIKQNLSSSFHPQTDGQTERVNSILEQYLRCYINYQQSDWSNYLPIAQFAYNNSKHSSTNTSPFYAIYGYHPRLSVTLPRTNKDRSPAEERLKNLHDLHNEMKFNIALAQEKHSQFYNKRVTPGPKYKINDMVWLSAKNIKSQRPTGKLDYKKLGPFKIIGLVGSRAYRLDLPLSMRIHPVFHINLLEPYHPDKIVGRQTKELPPVIVNGHQEYEVEYIVDSRIHRNSLQYLVHWKGYTTMDRTWESVKNLSNSKKLIQKFHQENPSRPSS